MTYHDTARRDRATAVGNMHKKFDKIRTCISGHMLVDRQTDRHGHYNILLTYRGQSNNHGMTGELHDHSI